MDSNSSHFSNILLWCCHPFSFTQLFPEWPGLDTFWQPVCPEGGVKHGRAVTAPAPRCWLPLSRQSLPDGPEAIPSGGILNSQFTVDGDQTLSHLHPHCPVKLQWKSLYLLKPCTISWLLLGLCPMRCLRSVARAKTLGRKGRMQKGKTVGRKRPSTGRGAKETIVGTRLVNLWQREARRNLRPWLCCGGQPNEHQDTSCTHRQCHLDLAPSSSLS